MTELRSTRKLWSVSVSRTRISQRSGGRGAGLGVRKDMGLSCSGASPWRWGRAMRLRRPAQATPRAGQSGEWWGVVGASATCSSPQLRDIDV